MDHHLKHRFLHDAVKRDYTTIDGLVFSIQYVTPTPTFTGVIGSYSTAPVSSSQTQSSADSNPTDGSANSSYQTSSSSSPSPSSSSSSSSTVANTPAPSYTAGTTSSDSAPSSATNSSMSIGGKIGIVAVIILIIGAILGLTLFFMSRKKKQAQAEQARQDAEKDAAAMAARQEIFVKRQNEDAPKLTLRPASSFLPDLLGGKRKSRLSLGLSNLLGTTTETNPVRAQYLAAIGKGSDIPMSEKSPAAENPFKDPENPFADPVKSPGLSTAPGSKPRSTNSTSSSSVSDPASPTHSVSARPDSNPDSAPGVVQISDKEIQSVLTKGQRQEPVEMPSEPVIAPALAPAPVRTQAPAAPQPARTPVSPASNVEGSVYRILMDFNPSMPDELELKAGQIVRMLHEYDDGWCLATRLDRSQQGVVPRTCLALKPSKPRPQQGNRPMSPAMRNSPPGSRPMSPAGSLRPNGSQPAAPTSTNNSPLSPGAYNQPPRPLSPGPRSQQKRSMSPGPVAPPQKIDVNQRRRSKSASARAVQDRRASPPGPSKLGPGTGVPGMAM